MILDFMSSLARYTGRGLGWKSALVSDIKNRADKLAEDNNNLNNEMSESVAKFAEGVVDVRKRMQSVSDIYLTISTISGNSNTEYNLSRMPIFSKEKIVVSGNTIRLESGVNIPLPIVDIDILTNGTLGNHNDYDDVRNNNKETLVTDSPVEVERIDGAINMSIIATIRDKSSVNAIGFTLSDFGVSHADVSYVEISEDGKSFRRVNFDLEKTGNNFTVTIQNSAAKAVRISLIQNNPYIAKNGKSRYAIGVSNFSIGLSSSVESGNIVFGPINSNSEVIKASIQANMPMDGYSFNNTQIEISPDNENWERVSIPFSVSEYPKHLDFNTLSEKSIKTKNPVKTLFLKLTLHGSDAKNNYTSDNINRHVQQLMSANPYITIPFALSDKYIIGKMHGYPYGERFTYSSFSDDLNVLDTLTSIKSESDYVIKSLAPMSNILKATTRSFYHKCAIEKNELFRIIPSQQMDTGTVRAFKISNPIKRPMRVIDSNNVILPFSNDAGVYTLTDGTISRKIDLRSGFFSSAYQWIYKAHNKDTYLINSLGFKVHIFEKGNPINLLDYFQIETPVQNADTPTGVVFNKNYPSAPLLDGEFSIVDNKLYSTSSSAIVDTYTFTKEEINLIFKANLNSVSIYTDNAKFSKTSERLTKYDGLKIAKLSKSGILKGSLVFKNKNASLVSFIKEVEYKNGIDEFRVGDKLEISIPKRVNRFSLGRKVDHFSDLNIIGYTEVFKSKVFSRDELIFAGDYMMEDIGNETFIQLPDGVFTHDLIETSIIINTDTSSAANGYYSIDYNNGILYSQSIISGETEVEYISSNVYITGNMIEPVSKSEYTVAGSQIQIKNISDGDKFVVLSPAKEDKSSEILKSPIVKNLTLNTVTI